MYNLHNITYPKSWQNQIVWVLWKLLFCHQGFHLFDEVRSTERHYLFCDACGLSVHIREANTNESD